MAIEVQPLPLPMLVDLVNGWGTVPRAKADARDRPPLAAFSRAQRRPAGGATDAALERVADALYPVFAAGGSAERARLVTDLMTTARIQPALGVAGDRIRPRWLVPRKRDALPPRPPSRCTPSSSSTLPSAWDLRLGPAAATPSRTRHRARSAASARSRARTASASRPSAAAGRAAPRSAAGIWSGHGGRGRQRQRLPRARPRRPRPRPRPRTPARAHFRAMGIDPDRLDGPVVGIAST